ncbi:MAG: esterase [Megasphaera sp.]|jgi:predicted peptidase|nr:esterase [Megasphaera sp.]
MKNTMAVVVAVCCMTAAGSAACAADMGIGATAAHKGTVTTVQATAVQQLRPQAAVYGDGEKVAAIILRFPSAIDPASLRDDSFAVEGRTIASIYTNNKASVPVKSVAGPYVAITLEYKNTASFAAMGKKKEESGSTDGRQRGKAGDAPMISDRKVPDLSVRVVQKKALQRMDGGSYAASPVVLTGTAGPAASIADFRQYTYTDPATGVSMPYNLYLPRSYDPAKSYPLVVFIADASANTDDSTTPLYQGNGAVVWASPQWQAQHPCIVLAPQYTKKLVLSLGMMTTDDNVWTSGLQLTTDLIYHVLSTYSVDRNRIYGTGQSQGGMANIAISDRHPGLFAGQFLVACQWDTEEMKLLKDKNLWILVCEGDTKAYPAMKKAVANWESLGTPVGQSPSWDSKASVSYLNEEAKAMAAQGRHINFTVFSGGNHMYTWSVAYTIDAIREWIFQQRLE